MRTLASDVAFEKNARWILNPQVFTSVLADPDLWINHVQMADVRAHLKSQSGRQG